MSSLLFPIMILFSYSTGALSLLKNDLLLQHNMYRSIVANGHLRTEPISNMKSLSWSNQLVKHSEQHIKSCINNETIHNNQSNQLNIFSHSIDTDIQTIDFISDALYSWFSQHQHYHQYKNSSCDINFDCNNYLNMVQMDYIGCDIGVCNDEILLVCNYGSCSQCTQQNSVHRQISSTCNHHCIEQCFDILSFTDTKCMEYCECESDHIMKRRLAKRLNAEDCCYHYITEYLVTISVSFQIFDDKNMSQIVPIMLYELVIEEDIENVNNFSISADQITSSEYTYYIDITTDSNSHMVRFRSYAANQLYTDYAEQYKNMSLIAIMLESSIGFSAITKERLVYIGPRNDTQTNDNVDNGINYEILNEWYFILILLVCAVGMVICVAVVVRHYYSPSGYDSVELIESELRNGDGRNIHTRRISVASCSSNGYDRSIALDETDRVSHVHPVDSASEDEDSLLMNGDNGEEHDAYLSYNPHYGL